MTTIEAFDILSTKLKHPAVFDLAGWFHVGEWVAVEKLGPNDSTILRGSKSAMKVLGAGFCWESALLVAGFDPTPKLAHKEPETCGVAGCTTVRLQGASFCPQCFTEYPQ